MDQRIEAKGPKKQGGRDGDTKQNNLAGVQSLNYSHIEKDVAAHFSASGAHVNCGSIKSLQSEHRVPRVWRVIQSEQNDDE
jgi:hypothetical protein